MNLPKVRGSIWKNLEMNFLLMAKKLDPKEIVPFEELLKR